MTPVAVLVGSAFHDHGVPGFDWDDIEVQTAFGTARLQHAVVVGRDVYLLHRHGRPHRYLPNQVPYRAHAAALRDLGCGALLVTSSVGVLDRQVALDTLLPVSDLLMPENRLPDGTACSMWPEPVAGQGHLVVRAGLFDPVLSAQVAGLAVDAGFAVGDPVVFGYVGGPRTKTPAENRLWARWGAQVNSMTLGPEVVLANELEIPCAALVTGHKYSHPDVENPETGGVSESLDASRTALLGVVSAFLSAGQAVPFGNQIYRFGDDHS